MEKKFAEGLMFTLPENAPAFVKGRVAFRVEEFKKFLDENKNENGFVNVDILEARAGGKYYGQLNEWKKSETSNSTRTEPQQVTGTTTDVEYPPEEINPEDIPF